MHSLGLLRMHVLRVCSDTYLNFYTQSALCFEIQSNYVEGHIAYVHTSRRHFQIGTFVCQTTILGVALEMLIFEQLYADHETHTTKNLYTILEVLCLDRVERRASGMNPHQNVKTFQHQRY